MLDDGEAEMGLVLAFEPSPNHSTPTRPRHLSYAWATKIRPSHPPTLAGAFAHTAASRAFSASSFATHAAAASSPYERW